MSNQITTVGVVGLGVMGFDIALLYAMKGFRTLAYDAAQSVMDSLADRRDHAIDRLRKRNRIADNEIHDLHTLLRPANGLADLSEADLITEAVSENIQTKLAVYQGLRQCGFNGLLASNTSSMTRATLVREGIAASKNVALTHFFNPVLHTQMVEVVTGDMDDTNRERILAFLKSLGRDPILVRDISGFVSNGILMVYAVMALRLIESGARIEQVDQAAKELRLLPPLFSFDSWKPSIVEDVTNIMRELRGDEFLRSSRLLTRLAEGNPRFYLEQQPNPVIYELVPPGKKNAVSDSEIKRALMTSMIVAAARVAELGESPSIVDWVATEGLKMPRPPLREIDAVGTAALLDDLAETNRLLGGQPLATPALLKAMASQDQTFYRNQQPNPWLISRVE